MKKIIYTFGLFLPLIFSSCSSDNQQEVEVPQKVTSLKRVFESKTLHHTLTLYSPDGSLYKGYNTLTIEIKDKEGNICDVDSLEFTPMMTMTQKNFKHTCPHQRVFQKAGRFFQGYSLFQMETGDAGYWDLNFTYTIAKEKYKVEGQRVEIKEKNGIYSSFKSFTSPLDGAKYFISLANHSPKIGLNKSVKIMLKSVRAGEVVDGVKQMEFFTPEGYTIEIDPRMAGVEMGNHSSANNIQPVLGDDGLYVATLNYTMGGNWTLNFIIKNDKGEVVAGSEVEDGNVDSKSNVAIEVDVPNDK